MYVYTYTYICVYMYIGLYICICIYTYVYMYMYIGLSIVSLKVTIYVCVYIYVSVYIYISLNSLLFWPCLRNDTSTESSYYKDGHGLEELWSYVDAARPRHGCQAGPSPSCSMTDHSLLSDKCRSGVQSIPMGLWHGSHFGFST